jgi:23S rRNA pseudouridine1911/1915/1917 synthase
MAARKETVTPELAGPLDRAVRGLFGLTWGKARTWIAAGKVRVGGKVVTEATARAAAGVELALDEAAPRAAARQSAAVQAGLLQVVHADPHIVVVAKPAGVSTVPYEGGVGPEAAEDTLEARVRAWIERNAAAGRPGRPNLGVVHRLDKETTGLVVFTRTWLAKKSLSGQFRRHTVHRRYFALAHGQVHKQTMRSVLVADRGDGLRGSSTRGGSEGREAVTHVEPLEALRGATLVACSLETGRTHQIRIHLSEAGHPLVGERVYIRGYPGPLLQAPRLMLHAAELGFVHPATEREMRWELPLPEDMREVLERMRL